VFVADGERKNVLGKNKKSLGTNNIHFEEQNLVNLISAR
jgi:hypothetical protein